ncbi:uncharacterized protein C2845_PM08G12150 [Panicum miliaceum]|uniref:Transposase MuDR plant domain-containing protein n=1 Tax=Panicum miliaceum TaxID=4540 RepID=A0A3L6R1Q2_PANMI|nr:uncharacterized protein C2845_PM08G12150 [Panicum miliaceum]
MDLDLALAEGRARGFGGGGSAREAGMEGSEGRPAWLTVGMDSETSYNLEFRIICPNARSKWYSFSKIVDSDTTNFKDLVDDVVEKYPCGYGDLVKLFYYCVETKTNIHINYDQDLLMMFLKHLKTKTCCLSIAYYPQTSKPPVIPLWYEEIEVPCTPSSINGSSISESQPKDNYLANPEPGNEHVGVDEDGMHIDICPELGNPSTDLDEEFDGELGSDSECESLSDSDYEEDEGDEMVHDHVPAYIPEIVYDRDDPLMVVGTIYPNMSAFKLASPSHAIKNEFDYNIEKSDLGRYRVYCSGRSNGCRWRIHASRMADKTTIKVKMNPHEHDCQSTRRSGKVKGASKFWVCEKVRKLLVVNPGLTAMKLQRRLQEHYKVVVQYKRVWYGKELALTQLFGD